MKPWIRNPGLGREGKWAKGAAMLEFAVIAPVSVMLLFVAVQFAFIGCYLIALGQLNYQVTRWATDPANNNIAGGQASPQCSDVTNLVSGSSVTPYTAASGIASGYIGKVVAEKGGVACGSAPPTKGGISVAMVCTPAPVGTNPAAASYSSSNCTGQRAAGTGVQITLTMDTSSLIFLSTSKTSPSFFGIPLPQTLSTTQVMLTQ